MEKMKIIAGIKVWREEDFILPCLGSIYNIVDEVRIVFGPVRAMKIFKPDRTRELITQFPDPDKKITVIQQDQWDTITDMANATLPEERCFYLRIDGDFVLSENFKKELCLNIAEAIKKSVPITARQLLFWKNFCTIADHKDTQEYKLFGFVCDKNSCFSHPDFEKQKFSHTQAKAIQLEQKFHHYGYVKPIHNIFPKMAYYWLHWQNLTPAEAFDQVKKSILSGTRPMWSAKFLKYQGLHPEEVKNHVFRHTHFEWALDKLDIDSILINKKEVISCK